MKIILLNGQQGSLKTSIWGAAITRFFEARGSTVSYIDCDGVYQEEYDHAIASGADVIIVDTYLSIFPYSGPQPDFTITCQQHDKTEHVANGPRG